MKPSPSYPLDSHVNYLQEAYLHLNIKFSLFLIKKIDNKTELSEQGIEGTIVVEKTSHPTPTKRPLPPQTTPRSFQNFRYKPSKTVSTYGTNSEWTTPLSAPHYMISVSIRYPLIRYILKIISQTGVFPVYHEIGIILVQKPVKE